MDDDEPQKIWQYVDAGFHQIIDGTSTVNPALNVTQFKIDVLEGGPFPRVQGLAQRHSNPKILYGEGNRAGSGQEAADDAHFPVRLSFDLLSANVHGCVYLYKETGRDIFDAYRRVA